MIDACAKVKDWQRAEHWMRALWAARMVPDLRSFNCVINACAQASEVDRAEVWLQKMREAGIRPDVVSFGSVMHATAREGNPERAEYWMQEMISNGVVPNIRCLNTILPVALSTGKVSLANVWMDRATNLGLTPNKITYQHLLRYYVKAQDIVKAEKVLKKMQAQGFIPDAWILSKLSFMRQSLPRENVEVQEKARPCYMSLPTSDFVQPQELFYSRMYGEERIRLPAASMGSSSVDSRDWQVTTPSLVSPCSLGSGEDDAVRFWL